MTASDGAVNDGFGSSVAASGDMVVVGAPNALPTSNRAGVAYVLGPSRALGAPPSARITAAKVSSKRRSAKFTFKASGASGFQCALITQVNNNKKHKHPKPHFSRCKSSKTYKHLKLGRYTFLVRARRAGKPETAARKNFKIS